MRIITVKIPEAYLRELDELVRSGIYPSRSEAIRTALRDLLTKEFHKPLEDKSFHKALYFTSKRRSFNY
ncbi:MAG: ribbon-helix-helix domain-containing protein [Candidatus Nezhaarchaeales archaeon]